MATFRDVANKSFNRLTAIKRVGSTSNRESIWLCKCECGQDTEVTISRLTSGRTKSCGCLAKENGKYNTVHGMTSKNGSEKKPVYRAWQNMKTRCYNPNYRASSRYLGRGIDVCKEWKGDFLSFYAFAINNGWQDGYHVHRKNNDKGYYPGNVEFLSPQEHKLIHKGGECANV